MLQLIRTYQRQQRLQCMQSKLRNIISPIAFIAKSLEPGQLGFCHVLVNIPKVSHEVANQYSQTSLRNDVVTCHDTLIQQFWYMVL